MQRSEQRETRPLTPHSSPLFPPMVLTTRKIKHIQANVKRQHAGRQQLVTLTLRVISPPATTATLQVNCVWRPQSAADQTLEGPANHLIQYGVDADAYSIFNAADISLDQLRAVLFLELTDPTPSHEPGQKYTLIDVTPIGMAPGYSRYYATWTKQH